MNAETRHPGFTALAAASAGTTMVKPLVVKLLLEAKADTSIAFTLPHMPNSPKQTARTWAAAQRRKEVVAIFDAFVEGSRDFECHSSRALACGAVDVASVDEIRARISAGMTSEAEEAVALHDLVKKHENEQAIENASQRGATTLRLIRSSLQGSAETVAALAEEVASEAAARPHPRGTQETLGGRCRLQGLQGAAELNGKVGRIVSWNADGRRRYAVRLESSGKVMSCQMRNVVAEDDPRLAYPHDFDCSSTEFVAALQAELRAQGSSGTVIDWTPLAAAVSDVAYLLHVCHEIALIDAVRALVLRAHGIDAADALAYGDEADEGGGEGGSEGGGKGHGEEDVGESKRKALALAADCTAAMDVLIFVRSEPQTAPFFLAHRELTMPGASMHSDAALAALPWLIFSKEMTILPQPWVQCCKKDYMVRISLNLEQKRFTCPICQEECLCIDNPSQMPCAHFMCAGCLKQFCPPVSALDRINTKVGGCLGLTCPVCRAHFPKHAVSEHPAAPGGIAIFESTTTNPQGV